MPRPFGPPLLYRLHFLTRMHLSPRFETDRNDNAWPPDVWYLFARSGHFEMRARRCGFSELFFGLDGHDLPAFTGRCRYQVANGV